MSVVENDGFFAMNSTDCVPGSWISRNISFFYYQCPFIIGTDQNQTVLTDLNINVNFSSLGGLGPSYPRPQLPLLIGLSNNLMDDYTHTVPITILPGVNMAAPYIWGIRQIYANGVLAALGMFEVSKSLF